MQAQYPSPIASAPQVHTKAKTSRDLLVKAWIDEGKRMASLKQLRSRKLAIAGTTRVPVNK